MGSICVQMGPILPYGYVIGNMGPHMGPYRIQLALGGALVSAFGVLHGPLWTHEGPMWGPVFSACCQHVALASQFCVTTALGFARRACGGLRAKTRVVMMMTLRRRSRRLRLRQDPPGLRLQPRRSRGNGNPEGPYMGPTWALVGAHKGPLELLWVPQRPI